MALFNFTLILSGVTSETIGLEDALYINGCDDALLCFYGKSVYLEFDREASSFDIAIRSAIENVELANIGAKVRAVDSAFVGLSDIAQLSGLTRQAISLLKDGTRGNGNFPSPLQRIKGQSPLWDWAEVTEWLEKNNRLHKCPEITHNARILCKWNLALQVSVDEDVDQLKTAIQQIKAIRSKIQ